MTNVTERPPEHININGTDYPINWDFKAWVKISDLLQSIDPADDEHSKDAVIEAVALAFGRIVDEPVMDVLNAMAEFMRGYPQEDNGYSGTEDSDGTKYFSLKHDLNYIILAIRNQSGIDLTYRRTEPFHWWDFMLEFNSLEGHHYISKIIGYRSYKGEDKDYIKLKNIYALPQELTCSEQRIVDEMNDLFYNS